MGTDKQPCVIQNGLGYATLSNSLNLRLYTSESFGFFFFLLSKGHYEAVLVTPMIRLLQSRSARISNWAFRFAVTEKERWGMKLLFKNASA